MGLRSLMFEREVSAARKNFEDAQIKRFFAVEAASPSLPFQRETPPLLALLYCSIAPIQFPGTV